MKYDEQKLYILCKEYHWALCALEELNLGVSPYAVDSRRRDIHDQMAELTGVDRSQLSRVLYNGPYETVDDLYVAVSDEVARINRG